jgi:hypothetical protein
VALAKSNKVFDLRNELVYHLLTSIFIVNSLVLIYKE